MLLRAYDKGQNAFIKPIQEKYNAYYRMKTDRASYLSESDFFKRPSSAQLEDVWASLAYFLEGKLKLSSRLRSLEDIEDSESKSILVDADLDFYTVILPAYAKSLKDRKISETELLEVLDHFLGKKDRKAVDALFNHIPVSYITDVFVSALIKSNPSYWSVDKVFKRFIKPKKDSEVVTDVSSEYELAEDTESVYYSISDSARSEFRRVFNNVTRTDKVDRLINVLERNDYEIDASVKAEVQKLILVPLEKELEKFLENNRLGASKVSNKIKTFPGKLRNIRSRGYVDLNKLLLSAEDAYSELKELRYPILRVLRLFTPTVYASKEDLEILKEVKASYKGAYKIFVNRVIKPQLAKGRSQKECIACKYKGIKKSLQKKITDKDSVFSEKDIFDYMAGVTQDTMWTGKEEADANFSSNYPQYNLCSPDLNGIHRLIVNMINDKKLRMYPDYKAMTIFFNAKVGSDLELLVHNFLSVHGIGYSRVHSPATFNSNKKIFLREVVPISSRDYPYDFYIPKLHLFIEVQGDKFHGYVPSVTNSLISHFSVVDPDQLSEAIDRSQNLIEEINGLPENMDFKSSPEVGKKLVDHYKHIVNSILSSFRNERDKHPKKLEDIQDLKEYVEKDELNPSYIEEAIVDLVATEYSKEKKASLVHSTSETKDAIENVLQALNSGLSHILKDHYKRYLVSSHQYMKDVFDVGDYRSIELHAKDFTETHSIRDYLELKKADAILISKVLHPMGIKLKKTIAHDLSERLMRDLIKRGNIKQEF